MKSSETENSEFTTATLEQFNKVFNIVIKKQGRGFLILLGIFLQTFQYHAL